ncbi:hypothetical protein MAJ_08886, partial [Metarhizium majus ARSEF 297]
MDVEQMLDIPQGEIAFLYPNDAPVDRFDRRFTTLRVPRRGLREWSSFEEDPAFIQKFMKLSTGYPTDWKPSVFPWTRYIASQTNMVDFLKSTLMLRLNIGLDTISPGMSVIGTAKHFNSYGTDDNRIEGAPEVHIGPDLTVFDGDIANPPDLQQLQEYLLTIGDAKVKHLNSYGTDDNRIEGAPEVHIGPDLTVFDGDIANPPDLQQLQEYLLTIGDAKVKHLKVGNRSTGRCDRSD